MARSFARQRRVNKRTERNERRKVARAQNRGPVAQPTDDQMRVSTSKDESPFSPRTRKQGLYYKSIMSNTLTFATGSAGTGKTYVSVSVACDLFKAGEIDLMIFARPSESAGPKLGFLPGTLSEKIDPWVAPIRDVLDQKLGASHVDLLIKRGKIRFQSFEHMRGLNWANAFIMLDEAQNCTPDLMKLFLLRVGENSRVVVDGDYRDQKDIRGYSGLEDALERMKGRPGVGHINFTKEDVVRSGFCRMVLEAYDAI